jgi:hypothetical protein
MPLEFYLGHFFTYGFVISPRNLLFWWIVDVQEELDLMKKITNIGNHFSVKHVCGSKNL